jgi:hypothetical protein
MDVSFIVTIESSRPGIVVKVGSSAFIQKPHSLDLLIIIYSSFITTHFVVV